VGRKRSVEGRVQWYESKWSEKGRYGDERGGEARYYGVWV